MKNISRFQTIKIWRDTLTNLYVIKGKTKEAFVQIIDRLVKDELEKVTRK